MAAPPVSGVPAAAQPSAAAAAGAAAAALLQRQLGQDAPRPGGPPNGGWTEHQTGDGRKFYFHEETQTSAWEKPEVLKTPEERANDTKWGEYRIWDGRVFYHNKDTKVSCWRMPPELRKMREGISGIDERPLPLTTAEQRRTLLDLMKARGVDHSWTWLRADDAVADEPQAELLTENVRKQCVAELMSLGMRNRMIGEREKQRNAANALERLIEERFAGPEDVDTTYEDATRILEKEEAWLRIKSDLRRHEVFQTVMERLEEKHKKARAEKRTERVVRLARFIASDPDMKRARTRWKDAIAILKQRDELQEEEPPLEALRMWIALRYDLKPASEHEAEAKAKVKPDPAAYREDRKRRDAFISCMKELATKGVVTSDTRWSEVQALAECEPRIAAMREGRGATAMELFDEFQEDVRCGKIVVKRMLMDEKQEVKKEEDDDEEKVEPQPKRQRKGFDPEEPFAAGAAAATAAAQAAAAVELRAAAAAATAPVEHAKAEAVEEVSALDAFILAGEETGGDAGAAGGEDEEDDDEDEEDEDDDPLMGVVNAAAAARAAEAKAVLGAHA